MTAIADLMLDPIKQYAQSLKKRLAIPLSRAQDLAAKCHNFTDWHELITVAKRNPYDQRLRGAALSFRSPPAVRTPVAVEVAMKAGERLAMLTGSSAEDCLVADRLARGLSGKDPLSPCYHLNFPGAQFAPAEAIGSAQFAVNLFDPAPRFVTVWGATGWGKSGVGVSVALAQAGQGGNVCYLDPFLGESFKSRDWAGNMRDSMLATTAGSVQITGEDGTIHPFSRITGIGCPPWGSARPPLDVLLRNIADRLLPFSVLVIDEPASIPIAGKEKLVAQEIDRIIAAGTAVVWLTQDMPTEESLPLSTATQENAALIIGRTYSWTKLPASLAGLEEATRKLPMTPGEFSGWIAATSTAQKGPEAYFLEVRCEDIERQSDQCSAQTA